MPTHRLQKPIPQDAAERRERIRWLFQHKVWTHPATIKMPPDDLDYEGSGWLNAPRDHWEERVVDDGSLQECWCVDVVYVDPETETIEDDESRNTAFRVWLEAGPWHDWSTEDEFSEPDGGWTDYNRWGSSHDHQLDCGAPTMEEALLKLASLVEVFYNEDGTDTDIDPHCAFSEDDKYECEPDDEGFCTRCGFFVEEISDEDG